MPNQTEFLAPTVLTGNIPHTTSSTYLTLDIEEIDYGFSINREMR